MIISILYVIIAFIIISLYIKKFLNRYKIFFDVKFRDLEKYWYVLKYRGIADESILQNAGFFFDSFLKDGILIGIVKYKEFGKTGFYFIMKKNDEDNKNDLFLKKIEELKLEYFIWEGKAIYSKYYVVDIHYNYGYFKELVKLFWTDIPEEDLYFDLNFRGSIAKQPIININNNDKEKIEKLGINFDIPILIKEFYYYSIKGKKTEP